MTEEQVSHSPASGSDITIFETFRLALYTAPAIRLSFLVPEKWGIGQTQDFPVACVAEVEEGFRANFAIAVDVLGMQDAPNLGEIAATTLEAISTAYQEFKLHEQNELTVDGRAAITRVFSWFDPGFNLNVMQRQTLIERGRNIYTISATSLESLAPKYLKLMEKMLESVRFN